MINTDAMIVGGFFIGALAVPVITLLVTLLRVEVEDGEVALVTRFGRLTRTLSEPGWHWVLDGPPWVRVRKVSTRRDFAPSIISRSMMLAGQPSSWTFGLSCGSGSAKRPRCGGLG